MADFFKHENASCPLSLSQNGKLCQGKKSNLVKCLMDHCQEKCNETPSVDAKILDGSVFAM